jgi:hypothetical protein
MKTNHRPHLLAIQPFGFAVLTNELAEYLLHFIEASNATKTGRSIDRLLRLAIVGFDKPVFFDICVDILDRHGDAGLLLVAAPVSLTLIIDYIALPAAKAEPI